MIVLLLCIITADTIEFYTDPVIYKTTIKLKDTVTHESTTEDFFYVEFNCEIPYQELHYQSAENIIYSNAIIPFKIVDQNRADSLVDTLYRQFTIPSFSYAAKQQVSFLVQFGTYLSDGEFKYEVEILSGDKKGVNSAVLELRKEDYTMSDILLSSEISLDTLDDYLRKGNLRVVPRPSHSFDQRFKNLCFYYELYDLPSDADTLSALYEITDDNGITVRRISRSMERVFHAQSVNCGFNIQSLRSGEYKLLVTISDDKENVLAQKETAFTIAKAQRQAVSYEGMPYYREIEYFLSPRQYKEFLSLPEEGKKPFLERFWRTFDYFTVAVRFDYVNDHYKFGDTPGYKTDRGRIYIKYGEPDEIEKPLPLQYREQRPYEHWQYPNGEQFIFVDVRGINDYILVWTNCLEERSQPTLYKYLPEELLGLVQ